MHGLFSVKVGALVLAEVGSFPDEIGVSGNGLRLKLYKSYGIRGIGPALQ
jgi:hypothetical protein